MRFDVLTAVKMSMLVLWITESCGLVRRYQCFGGKYCLCLQGYNPNDRYVFDISQPYETKGG
jgi:hypothetical protein